MKKILIMSLVAMAVVSCNKEVTCSSEETQSLVKGTFMDSVQSELKSDKTISEDKREKIFNWLESNTVFSIENIQTITNNKDTGAQQCKADFSISIESTVPNSIYSLIKSDKEKLASLVNGIAPLDNVKYDNQKFTKTIEYSTRMTDDNKKQILELSGIGKFTLIAPTIAFMNLAPTNSDNDSYIGHLEMSTKGEFFEGYKYNAGIIDCKSKVFIPRYSAVIDEIVNKCQHSYASSSDNENPMSCIVIGKVKKGEAEYSDDDFTEISDIKEVDIPLTCH